MKHSATWLLVSACALAGVARAETTPAPSLVTFERRGADPTFSRVFTVHTDGRFDYLGETGEIEESHLQVVAILLAKAKFEVAAGPACDAPIEAGYRITTPRGTVTWETPCRAVPHPSVDALLQAIELQLTLELNRPPVWVERQRIAIDGTIGSDLAILRNGAYRHGGKMGVLSATEREQLARSIEAARWAVAAECKIASPKSERRLWAWPHAVEYADACRGKLDTGAVQLDTQVERILTRAEPKILVTLEAQAGADRPWVSRATVFADGAFVVGELTGRLSPSELAAWTKQVNAAKLTLVASTETGGGCVKPSPITYRVRTARGEVKHRACDTAPPHPMVATLETKLQALRSRDPRRERVLYLETAPDGAPRREELVFADGSMLIDGDARVLDRSNVSSLQGQLSVAKLTSNRRGDCAAKQTRYQLEAPGIGHLQWSEPCDSPDTSVRALVERVAVLRASAKPKK